jgi:hypothetical protein
MSKGNLIPLILKIGLLTHRTIHDNNSACYYHEVVVLKNLWGIQHCLFTIVLI